MNIKYCVSNLHWLLEENSECMSTLLSLHCTFFCCACTNAYFTKINAPTKYIQFYEIHRDIWREPIIYFFCVFLANRLVTSEIFFGKRVKGNGSVTDAERRSVEFKLWSSRITSGWAKDLSPSIWKEQVGIERVHKIERHHKKLHHYGVNECLWQTCYHLHVFPDFTGIHDVRLPLT